MPISKQCLAEMHESGWYHIICKSIQDRKLFLSDENKRFFLQRYVYYLGNFVETYAYCLLDNHVHWLIRIRSAKDILIKLEESAEKTPTHLKMLSGNCTYHELIEQQFNRFSISYANAFNKYQQQSGHLFQRPFRRISIKEESHITQLFIYIHANCCKHGICRDLTKYNWSSYGILLNNSNTFLETDATLERFGGKERFIKVHEEMATYYYEHIFSGE